MLSKVSQYQEDTSVMVISYEAELSAGTSPQCWAVSPVAGSCESWCETSTCSWIRIQSHCGTTCSEIICSCRGSSFGQYLAAQAARTILFSLHGCAASYAAGSKAKNSLICKNVAIWVCVPHLSLIESLCLVMAVNHSCLIDGSIFHAADVRPGAGAWWVILAPGGWPGTFFKRQQSAQGH